MAALATFWQLPEEETTFIDYVLTTGDVVAFPARSVRAKDELEAQPLVSYIDTCNERQILLTLQGCVEESSVESYSHNSITYYSMPTMMVCAVSYTRPTFYASRLSRSNLVAYWKYPKADKSGFVAKDERFVKWAKRILGWARRFASEKLEFNGFYYRATPGVKRAVDQGKLEVML